MDKISIIVSCYNEEEMINLLYDKLVEEARSRRI